jgi:succinate dehydrogenase/fumarate reductase cytochrome b subunit
MGDWIVSLILCCIPCVGIIMLFVWAFSKTEPKSKSNWAKAQLIFVGVVLVLYIIIIIIAAGSTYSAYSSMLNH